MLRTDLRVSRLARPIVPEAGVQWSSAAARGRNLYVCLPAYADKNAY